MGALLASTRIKKWRQSGCACRSICLNFGELWSSNQWIWNKPLEEILLSRQYANQNKITQYKVKTLVNG